MSPADPFCQADLISKRNLCGMAVKCFHVSIDSVKRYAKRLENCGDTGFFTDAKRNGGTRYKLLPDVIARMQSSLDKGISNSAIARREGVSEGTIRHAIKTGTLKKSLPR